MELGLNDGRQDGIRVGAADSAAFVIGLGLNDEIAVGASDRNGEERMALGDEVGTMDELDDRIVGIIRIGTALGPADGRGEGALIDKLSAEGLGVGGAGRTLIIDIMPRSECSIM